MTGRGDDEIVARRVLPGRVGCRVGGSSGLGSVGVFEDDGLSQPLNEDTYLAMLTDWPLLTTKSNGRSRGRRGRAREGGRRRSLRRLGATGGQLERWHGVEVRKSIVCRGA